MNENYGKMILLLSDQEIHEIDWCMKELGVTSRTLRTYVKDINDLLSGVAEIQLKRGQGYYLEIYQKVQYQQFIEEYLVQSTANEGSSTELIRYFIDATGPLKKEWLAEQLYVSKTTFDNYLSDVRQFLRAYDLEIIASSNEGLVLNGEEVNKRRVIEDYLYETIISEEESQLIKDVVHTNLGHYNLDRASFQNVCRAAAITLQRLTQGFEAPFMLESEFLLKTKEYNDCLTVCFVFESLHDVPFDIGDVQYLARALYARSSKDLSLPPDRSFQEIIETIINQIYLQTGVKIAQSMKLDLLAHHLEYMIRRSRLGVAIANPLLATIKREYPLAWLMSEIASEVLEAQFELTINENEKALLATHFGSYIEQEKRKRIYEKKIIVISDKGIGTTYLFINRLQNKLPRAVSYTVVDANHFDVTNYASEDVLVFLTDKMPAVSVKNALIADDLFNVEAIAAKISSLIDFYLPLNSAKDLLLEHLVTATHYYMISASTYEEALATVGADLERRGVVQSDFTEQLLVKEQLTATIFSTGVSMPHTTEGLLHNQTATYVINLQEPVSYQGKNVSLIFLVLLEKDQVNQKKIIHLYDEIIQIAKKAWMVTEINQCRSFAEFSQVLAKIKKGIRRE